MKKQYILAASMMAIASSAMAQETYESAQIATEDLNGTARYIGMGGAMEALGADISTISSNPAGIGMFRRSWVGGTFGLTTMPEQNNLSNTSKTATSFDQVGFVFSSRYSENSFINFAANYHKSRNFNQILPAVNALNGGAMNKLSYIGAQNNNVTSQVDNLLDYTIWRERDDNGQEYTQRYYNEGTDYEFRREQSGYIGEYDINISGNSKDRIYWGFTVGIKDVHYKGTTEYDEYLVDASNASVGDIYLNDYREINGTGYDIKGGIIFRPIEASPFRIGLSVATPTWYTLTSGGNAYLINNTQYGINGKEYSSESYKYRINTPWKFGASMGTTVGNYLALGASYEYADYSSIDNRTITDEYYDYYYDTTDTRSESDYVMNSNTKKCLQGVHTLKVGGEYKLTPELAVRLGYNYVSPMYKKTGSRDFSLNCDGNYYASTTDYTNWKDTQRLTIGLGYSIDNFSIDLAYMYSTQKGDFYPFPAAQESATGAVNNTQAVSVNNERHQISLSLGYRF